MIEAVQVFKTWKVNVEEKSLKNLVTKTANPE